MHIAPSNGDIGGRSFLYGRAAFWLKEEPELGKIVLRQIADYFLAPRSESGYPAATSILFGLQWNAQRNEYELDVSENAMLDGEQLALNLACLGYTPRPGGRLARLVAPYSGTDDAELLLIVDSATQLQRFECRFQTARIARIISGEPQYTTCPTIDFSPGLLDPIDEGLWFIVLRRVGGKEGWWWLARSDRIRTS